MGEIYFYTGKVGANHKQVSFIKRLESIDYIVKAKEVKRIRVSRSAYEWKGNLDVELTIDVLANLNKFDTIVLMSGDSDFAPLVDTVKKAGRRVIVMSTKGHIAKELIERAKYVNIKKLKEFITYRR